MSDLASRPAPLSSDYMAALAAVESRWPVLQWQAESVALWPLLRVRWMFAEWAASAARAGSVSQAPQRPSRRLLAMAAGALRSMHASVADARARDRGPARRDIVFLSDGLSFARLGTRWVERFCDPLIETAAARGLRSALWTPLHHYHRPRRSASRFVQTGIDLANLRAMLPSRRAALEPMLPAHDEVVARLRAAGFASDSLAKPRIAADTSRLLGLAAHFGTMLARTRPRLAFLVSYYGLEGFAFVLACRRAGVPVVDIQHGVQGQLHPAYGAWPRPVAGRHDLLPDRFWVWSAAEQAAIAAWSEGSAHRAVVGGNPWLEVWSEGSRWEGVGAATDAAGALKARAGGRPVVLVTLQFGLAPAEQLRPLVRLIRRAGSALAFWVRLHPVMLAERDAVRRELGDDVSLDEASTVPLHALLPQADLHMTHSSSTVIEASQFGLPSILTSAFGAELYESAIAAGLATIETGDEAALLSAIDRQLRMAPARRMPQAAASPAFDQLLAELAPARESARA